MNTADIAEDALILVSVTQRMILDSGVAACYSALDNTGDRQMDRYHAWATNLHTGIVEECDLSDENVMDMVEMDPVDVDAAIEEAGWCGALGATYGFPFVICPIGTELCPPDGVAFMRAQLVERG